MSATGMLFWGLVFAIVPASLLAVALQAALSGDWIAATAIALPTLLVTPALMRWSIR